MVLCSTPPAPPLEINRRYWFKTNKAVGGDSDVHVEDDSASEDESGSDHEVEDALDDDLFFEDEDGGDGDVDAGHVGAEGAAEGAEALMGAAELDDDYDAEASGSEGEEPERAGRHAHV